MLNKLIFAILIISFVLLSADTTDAVEFERWGFKFGYNYADVKGDKYLVEDIDSSTKQGIILGIWTNFRFNRCLSFQPELMFSQKGYYYRASSYNIYSGLTDYGRFDKHYAYFDIPLLLKYRIPLLNWLVLDTFAGPRLSIFAHEYDTLSQFATDGTQWALIDEGSFTKVNYGFTAGASFRLHRFSIEVRYSLDLNDYSSKTDLQHSVVSLMFVL